VKDQPQDPIRSPTWMAEDGNISLTTWHRRYRHHPKLRIIRVSPRRIGARESNWRVVLEAEHGS
jgi:hypothetical protein